MKHICSFITFVVMLALVASATAANAQRQTPAGNVQAQVAAATDTTFAHFFLQDYTTANPWWRSHTVVDGSGGVHLTFNDTTNIYYAYCAANCYDSANWLELPLFAVGTYDSMNEPTLGVDANGHPRLMWFAEYTYPDSYYFYAECDANCADNSANWTSVAVVSAGGYDYPHNVRYAALDTQGRPHLIHPMDNYPDYGFYYLTCDAGCTTASNWYTTTVTTPGLEPEGLQLVFDPNDWPRVLGHDTGLDTLVYAECNSSCSTAANWGSVALPATITYLGVYDGFSLRVDTQGRPRVAYYDGNADNNVLYYAWSNDSPLTTEGWHSYTLNYPGDSDYWTVDLALDSQGRPSVAFATDQLDLSYVTCTANCETTSPTWQQQFVETGDDLDASYPIPLNPDCVASTWMIHGYPSLALDAVNSPSVSYWVRHGQMCYDSQGHLGILYDARGIRFATVGGAVTTPTAPTSVAVNGPTTGIVDVSHSFTATVDPITATTPITYVWEATGQTTQTHAGGGVSDTASFTWPAGDTGSKTITVTASNAVGSAVGSGHILISTTPIIFSNWIYLPLITR